MRDDIILLPVDLRLFDGEGGGDTGGSQAGPDSTRPGDSGGQDLSGVVYGKQEGGPVAGGQTEVTSDTLEARRARYDELINSPEYKEFYTQDTQRMIDRRFAETKGLQEELDAVSPVIDMLLQRYGMEEGDMDALMAAIDDDSHFWAEAAEDAGMTVDQYKEFSRMERQLAAANRQLAEQEKRETQARHQMATESQLQDWFRQAEALKSEYPSIDLVEEQKNPVFMALIRNGFPVRDAYERAHMQEIMEAVSQARTQEAARMITGNIRARGTRPTENGARRQAGVTVKTDVHKLTKADRAEILRRVQKGEKISF